VVKAMASGAFASIFYSYYNAVIYTIKRLDITIVTIVLFFSALLTYIFFKSKVGNDNSGVESQGSAYKIKLLKTLLCGFVCVLLSYPTAVYNLYNEVLDPAVSLYSYSSRVHTAAAFGSAMIISSLYLMIANKLDRVYFKRVAAVTFAVFISILIGYGQLIQYDYEKAWKIQQWVWTSILEQAPDMEDSTLIFVDGEGIPDSKFINTHIIGPPFALAYLRDFPSEWKRRPVMNYKDSMWLKRDLRLTGDRIEVFLRRPDRGWVEVPDGNVIFFDNFRGSLVRREGKVHYMGREINLKPKPAPGAVLPDWPRGYLHKYLIRPDFDFNLSPERVPRELKAPAPVKSVKTFDGTNFLHLPEIDRSDIESYTIEMWLKPSERDIPRSTYTETAPPMPCIIGPVRLDQLTENRMMITLATETGEPFFYIMNEMQDGEMNYRWLHIEVDVDNKKKTAAIFINGRKEKESKTVTAPFKGPFKVGKGFAKRFWKGEVADLRISSRVRHSTDFTPEDKTVEWDEVTLYLMPGF
ncbi:MAG: LamG-like jellyroll fold domain-containing protein, partial [Thermodesulfobacteriota bacterium]